MRLLRDEFTLKWMKANLVGLLVGVFFGPILSIMMSMLAPSPNPYPPPSPFHISPSEIVAIVRIWVPIGACWGAAQQSLLRSWNVKPLSWIIATVLGFVLPVSLIASVSPRIAWMSVHNEWGYLISNILDFAEPFIVGLMIGGFQAWLLRKSITKWALWIASYLGGVIATGIFAALLFVAAFAIAEPVEKFFYANDMNELVYWRDGLMLLVMLMLLPFGAAFAVGLPTSLILRKYSREQNASPEAAWGNSKWGWS